jgi:hypothetical protein
MVLIPGRTFFDTVDFAVSIIDNGSRFRGWIMRARDLCTENFGETVAYGSNNQVGFITKNNMQFSTVFATNETSVTFISASSSNLFFDTVILAAAGSTPRTRTPIDPARFLPTVQVSGLSLGGSGKMHAVKVSNDEVLVVADFSQLVKAFRVDLSNGTFFNPVFTVPNQVGNEFIFTNNTWSISEIEPYKYCFTTRAQNSVTGQDMIRTSVFTYDFRVFSTEAGQHSTGFQENIKRKAIFGLAKTSGTAGQTVEVFVNE